MEARVDVLKTVEILRALANGIDPHTGEEFPAESPYQHPQTVRALFTALRALEPSQATQHTNRAAPNATPVAESDELLLTPVQETLYEHLRHWRGEKSREAGLAPYVIATNAQLRQMATMQLKAAEELLQVKGFGERRAQKYGREILMICTEA